MKKIHIITLVTVIAMLSGCTQQTSRQNTIQPVTNTAPVTKDTTSDAPNVSLGQKLDLQRQGLESLPKYVLEITDLEELDISYNRLTGALPAEIRNLQNLKILRASDNKMTGLPAELGQLKNLEVLDVSNNQLTGLPIELGYLGKLKTFNISGNAYSELDLGLIKDGLPESTEIIY